MSRTNEEVRDEILKKVRKLDRQDKRKKRIIYYCISAAACIAVILAVSVHNFGKQSNVSLPVPSSAADNGSSPAVTDSTSIHQTETEQNDSKSTIPDITTELVSKQPIIVSDTADIRLFKASGQNPDFDSFAEDELQHIDVVLNGSMVYRQLPAEQYAEYGFGDRLEKSDFGEYIGTVTETSDYDISVKIGSQEPALKGSSVYYYGSSNKSALIVQKNEYCSIFVFDQYANQKKTPSLKETYILYGAYSADDIAYLSYTIQGMDGNQYVETERGIVRDRNKIEGFYKITSALVPYETNDPIAMTPDWLVKAQENYNEHPDNFKREDFNINIYFNNGTVLKNISYKPYIASGCVDQMEQLTPEQNKELRAALTAD